ncbi:DUF5050 domain-containing protein [Paenibacillus agaridevorans]|uniref:DUF5050 domain-containing protein n=1 Tax=Paenibacillus agaridevorans TaxID=171404 RepID=UPI001BE3D66B|nr:DUF5050 domain-containing protein [Paenibacillus agaridevorans]
MRRNRSRYALAFLFCLILMLPAVQISASEASVKVTLPTFKVNLNGHVVENQYREYPLLVYRGITYFPMTWNDTRMLGLETTWSQTAGLHIKQSQVTSAYASYKSGSRNATSYSAKISTSAITVNGKAINNSKEQYPLLNFRNMTYFPLTWRFAYEEFGWDYKWNAVNGLSITSQNPQVRTVDLPSYAAENDVALFKGYYYFVETTYTTSHVYRAPVNQPSDKEEIYSYSHPDSRTSSDLLGPFSFQIRDNTLWFIYRLGGGVMGSDYFVKIVDDGMAKLMHSGSLDFHDTPYGTLILRHGDSAFEGGNLSLSSAGESEKVGDPSLMYAVTLSGTWWSLGSGKASYMAVNGDHVYVLASRDESDANKIYEINLKTNKTKKIVDASVGWFQVIDQKLYYVKDKDKSLYSSDIDGKNEVKLSEHAVTWFESIDGNLFYTTKKSSTQYDLYKVNPNGDDTLAWGASIAGVQVVNNQLVCLLGGNNGVALLDGSGRLLLKVSEPIGRVFTSDNGLLFQKSNDSSLAIIR